MKESRGHASGGGVWGRQPSPQRENGGTVSSRAILSRRRFNLHCRPLFVIFKRRNFHQGSFRVATVLIGKLEIIIFEESVHEDDEFAHTGGHGDKGFLSGGS
jgi:hypothetical protein